MHRLAEQLAIDWLPASDLSFDELLFEARHRSRSDCGLRRKLREKIVGFSPARRLADAAHVAPEHQNKGAGKVLLDFAKAQRPRDSSDPAAESGGSLLRA